MLAGGLVDCRLDRLAVRAIGDDVGQRVEGLDRRVVELSLGQVGLQAIVIGVIHALGPVAGAFDPSEGGFDGRLVGVRRDVALVAGQFFPECGVVDHAEDGREGVRQPNRSFVGNVVDNVGIGGLGEVGHRLIVDPAVGGGLEAVEVVDQLVELRDVKIAGLPRV